LLDSAAGAVTATVGFDENDCAAVSPFWPLTVNDCEIKTP
jgi:hypothetical protein